LNVVCAQRHLERRAQRPRAAGRTRAQHVADRLLLRERPLSGEGRVPGMANYDHGPRKRAQTSDQLSPGGAIGGGRDLGAEGVDQQAQLQEQRGRQQRTRHPAATPIEESGVSQPGEQRDCCVRRHQHVRIPAGVQPRHPRRSDQAHCCRCVVRRRRPECGTRTGPPCQRPPGDQQDHQRPLAAQDVIQPEPNPQLAGPGLMGQLTEDVVPVPPVGRCFEHGRGGEQQPDQHQQCGDADPATGDSQVTECGCQREQRGLLGEAGKEREHPEGDPAAHSVGPSAQCHGEQRERQEQRVDPPGVEPGTGDPERGGKQARGNQTGDPITGLAGDDPGEGRHRDERSDERHQAQGQEPDAGQFRHRGGDPVVERRVGPAHEPDRGRRIKGVTGHDAGSQLDRSALHPVELERIADPVQRHPQIGGDRRHHRDAHQDASEQAAATTGGGAPRVRRTRSRRRRDGRRHLRTAAR
jgi:hypothetical protein